MFMVWMGAQVRTIERVCEIPHEGPFCDLMWSDPEDIETWAVSPRGAGWLFGSKVQCCIARERRNTWLVQSYRLQSAE